MANEETHPFLKLVNKKIRHNIYIQRKIAGLKAFDVDYIFHTFVWVNEKQNDAILSLINSVTEMNRKIFEIIEQK